MRLAILREKTWIYISSLVIVTLYHFCPRGAVEPNRSLKAVFNAKIREINPGEERYYILVKRIINNNRRQFEDVGKYIELGYSEERMEAIEKLVKGLYNYRCEVVWLFNSIPTNLGIFMPILFPILVCLISVLKLTFLEGGEAVGDFQELEGDVCDTSIPAPKGP
jgi:hypothetical protein